MDIVYVGSQWALVNGSFFNKNLIVKVTPKVENLVIYVKTVNDEYKCEFENKEDLSKALELLCK